MNKYEDGARKGPRALHGRVSVGAERGTVNPRMAEGRGVRSQYDSDMGEFSGPGQTHRDAPLTPRGEVIWRVILGVLIGVALAVVIYVALT